MSNFQEARLPFVDSEPEQGGAPPSPCSLSFQNGNWYLMAKTGSLARQRWSGMLAQLKVSPSQYGVLMALGEAGPLGQQRLAELVGVDPRNAVPIIDALAAQGLVHREVDPADRRRRVLDLTAKGRRIVGDLASVGAEIERDLLSPLTPAEQVTLRRMLRALLDAASEAG
jgi:MarR family transcriptional regulator, temperature-dependent positive regulator of motility